MITIREFANQIEAGIVQSFLSDNEIDSILADENARAWVGAPNLVPIRLQVPEEQAEQAKALLDKYDNAHIARVQPAEVYKKGHAGLILFIAISLLAIVAIFVIPIIRQKSLPASGTEDYTWADVARAVDHFKYERAANIARQIIQKYPEDYYGYTYLGYIYLATGDVQNAEINYKKACELLPTEENEKILAAIEKRIMKQKDAGQVRAGFGGKKDEAK